MGGVYKFDIMNISGLEKTFPMYSKEDLKSNFLFGSNILAMDNFYHSLSERCLNLFTITSLPSLK